MKGNEEIVFPQLPPCWVKVTWLHPSTAKSLPPPLAQHPSPAQGYYTCSFVKPCPHQNSLQITQLNYVFDLLLELRTVHMAYNALNDLTSASHSSFMLFSSWSLTSHPATQVFSSVLKHSKPVPISGFLSLPRFHPSPQHTDTHIHHHHPLQSIFFPSLREFEHSLLRPPSSPTVPSSRTSCCFFKNSTQHYLKCPCLSPGQTQWVTAPS